MLQHLLNVGITNKPAPASQAAPYSSTALQHPSLPITTFAPASLPLPDVKNNLLNKASVCTRREFKAFSMAMPFFIAGNRQP